MLRIDEVETPIGTLHLAANGEALCAVSFGPLDLRRFGGIAPQRARLGASERIRAYFEGDLRALDELPVDPGGTPFQRSVWALLRKIPAGETRTYGQLAARLGSSPRAVGSANGANPICLVIPCHRVIAADGTLCGYAWGEDRKGWLLRHERVALRPSSPAREVAAG